MGHKSKSQCFIVMLNVHYFKYINNNILILRLFVRTEDNSDIPNSKAVCCNSLYEVLIVDLRYRSTVLEELLKGSYDVK